MASNTPTTFSAEAILVDITNVVTIGDTGAIPTTGGYLTNNVGTTNWDSGALSMQAASSSALGGGNESIAGVSLQNFQLTYYDRHSSTEAVVTISASSIQAMATASYTATGAVVTASSQITGLSVSIVGPDGSLVTTPITVTGAPNQKITYSGFTLVINQQTSSTSGSTGNITFSALQIITLDCNCVDAVIGSVKAGIVGGSCPPAADQLQNNFNQTAISKGCTVWFNCGVNIEGVGSSPCTLVCNNASISFWANGLPVTVPVPSSCVNYSSTATTSTSCYDTNINYWVTTVPLNYNGGNVFCSGCPYTPASSIPGGVSGVTYSCNYCANSASSVTVNWQWTAAAFTSFQGDLNACGVKPIDASSGCQWQNSDSCGTPENCKTYVTSGACGNGNGWGNWSGYYSNQDSVQCCSAGLVESEHKTPPEEPVSRPDEPRPARPVHGKSLEEH
jgi:hypothetical protein